MRRFLFDDHGGFRHDEARRNWNELLLRSVAVAVVVFALDARLIDWVVMISVVNCDLRVTDDAVNRADDCVAESLCV